MSQANGQRIVFYVTGHGFGHARRSAAVIAALVSAQPHVEVIVRTSAPARIFADLPRVVVDPPTLPLDFGAAEIDATTIDIPATLAGLRTILARQDEIVAHEVSYLAAHNIDLVLADIPFVVGEIVRAFRQQTGRHIPAIAIGNFTWDWIYDPYFASDASFASTGDRLRAAYANFDLYLRLPFSHAAPFFPQTQDVPLVARAPARGADVILRRMGLGADPRPRVLLAMRGGMSPEMLVTAARTSPAFLFLSLQPLPPDAPPNLIAVAIPPDVDFTDVLSTCHVVVSKLGYGLVADAIVCQTALLWPARANFREDTAFRGTLGRYIRTLEIPTQDFRAGRWHRHLEALLGQPAPAETMATDGAVVCAAAIAKHL